MKALFLACAVLVSASAFATTATVTPASPVVFKFDFRSASGEYIQGPWFQANYAVNATENLVLTSVDLHITSDKSAEDLAYHLPMGGVEVAAGASYILPLAYVYRFGPLDRTVYKVTIKYNGWLGTKFSVGGKLNLSTTFVTQ